MHTRCFKPCFNIVAGNSASSTAGQQQNGQVVVCLIHCLVLCRVYMLAESGVRTVPRCIGAWHNDQQIIAFCMLLKPRFFS